MGCPSNYHQIFTTQGYRIGFGVKNDNTWHTYINDHKCTGPSMYTSSKHMSCLSQFLLNKTNPVGLYMGVSKNMGTPKRMVYNGKPYQNGWLGGTTIFGNTHMVQLDQLLATRRTSSTPPAWPPARVARRTRDSEPSASVILVQVSGWTCNTHSIHIYPYSIVTYMDTIKINQM